MAKKTTTAVANWDQQLADAAKIAMEAEKGTGGNFFSIKGGILTFDGAPVTGNKMVVVILDSLLENVYYEGEYDVDNPTSPKCFAYARTEDGMKPHQQVFERGDQQSDLCSSCKHNVFGSADKGKGKACKNTRRLALIPAGTYDKDKMTLYTKPEQFTSSIAFLKLPVTSVKDYSLYVKQLATGLNRPPFGIITNVAVVPDPKNQFKVVFTAVEKVSDTLIQTMIQRNQEAATMIDFPYPAQIEGQAPAKKEKAGAKKGRKY